MQNNNKFPCINIQIWRYTPQCRQRILPSLYNPKFVLESTNRNIEQTKQNVFTLKYTQFLEQFSGPVPL